VDFLSNTRILEKNSIRFIAVTKGCIRTSRIGVAVFLLHVLGTAAEFERALSRERTQAGRARYKQDFESGKVGNTVHSRSGRNLPPHRPTRVFDRDEVLRLRRSL
jgi:DNA invertase Pin-like site-specific DNA recombinase